MHNESIERVILLVESNPEHERVIKAALSEVSLTSRVTTAHDGSQALDVLHGRGRYADGPCPNMILLDLNLPDRDGKAVLAEIKADPRLRRIPIVILTFSNSHNDVLSCYELQGNCYVVKSTDMAQLSSIVRRIEAFWLRIVTLPEVGNPN